MCCYGAGFVPIRHEISVRKVLGMVQKKLDKKPEGKKAAKKPEERMEANGKRKPAENLQEAKHAEKKPEEKREQKPAEKREEKPGKGKGYNPWDVLRYPHLAEKSMNMVELENKLVFMVSRKSTKSQIKEAVERGFNVKVLSVNVEITRKGAKKAYIKLAPENMASDIASRMGMI